MKVLVSLFFLLILFTEAAMSANYYISPQGNNSSSGNSIGSPWKTFAYSIPKLRAGDTLNLLDGIYDGATSGYPTIDCGATSTVRNAVNGTRAARITIRALKERRARINGDGVKGHLIVRNCSYWNFEGLTINSRDIATPSAADGIPAFFVSSRYLTIRRFLIYNNNRYTNSSCMALQKSHNSLIEENEFYHCHRNVLTIGGNEGFSTIASSYNTIRRNYIHGRSAADISSCTGYPKTTTWTPGTARCSSPASTSDGGFTCYPCANNIFENNIAEGIGTGFDLQAINLANGNRFLGNISLGNNMGFLIAARANTLAAMPQNNIISNMVILNSSSIGMSLRANKNTRINNVTILNSKTNAGVVGDNGADSASGDGRPTLYLENILSAFNFSTGFRIIEQYNWKNSFSNSYRNSSVNYSPLDGNTTSCAQLDPKMGTCKVWIPSTSPMKRNGKNGADMGANILFKYQDGTLTTQRLWNPSTGSFPCGAVVPGINNVVGASCNDVHIRLNVNRNGCLFPAG